VDRPPAGTAPRVLDPSLALAATLYKDYIHTSILSSSLTTLRPLLSILYLHHALHSIINRCCLMFYWQEDAENIRCSSPAVQKTLSAALSSFRFLCSGFPLSISYHHCNLFWHLSIIYYPPPIYLPSPIGITTPPPLSPSTVTMCYLVVERYSVCRCLYYQHSVDMCAAYGTQGHPIQERTILIGYTCEKHSMHQEQEDFGSREGYSDSGYGTASHGSSHMHSSRQPRR
jgi:hypothetical protein